MESFAWRVAPTACRVDKMRGSGQKVFRTFGTHAHTPTGTHTKHTVTWVVYSYQRVTCTTRQIKLDMLAKEVWCYNSHSWTGQLLVGLCLLINSAQTWQLQSSQPLRSTESESTIQSEWDWGLNVWDMLWNSIINKSTSTTHALKMWCDEIT